MNCLRRVPHPAPPGVSGETHLPPHHLAQETDGHPPPAAINSFDAVIHMQESPPQKRFLVGCSSTFMRLAQHRTALASNVLLFRLKADVVLPGVVGTR